MGTSTNLTRRSLISSFAMGALALAGCAGSGDKTTETSEATEATEATEAAATTSAADLPWWKKTIVYEAYPKSFQSSMGGETGDIAGVTSRLDYLKELGVGAIWLTPVFVSPMADNGYDVADYYNIDPSFGTMDDMDKLLAQAADRDIKIVLDMVVNHTSNQNAWFVESSFEQGQRQGRLVHLARPRRGRRCAQQLAQHLRRQRVDLCRGARPVLPAHLPGRAARPQLGERGGPQGGHQRLQLLA